MIRFFLLFCLSIFSFANDFFKFVPASIEERDALVDLAIESNDIYGTRKVGLDIVRDVFALSDASIESGGVEVLKYEDNIVGFYSLRLNNEFPTHELGHLFVKAGLQYQGLETMLFHRAVGKARAFGWEKIEWLSDPDAEEFYLKMGAEVIGHCENLLNPDVDLPIFRYTIF